MILIVVIVVARQTQTSSFINKAFIDCHEKLRFSRNDELIVDDSRRETFYSPHKARSLIDYSKVEILRDRGGE